MTAEPHQPPNRGLALVGILLLGGLLASCCIGGVVAGMRFLGPTPGEKKTSDIAAGLKDAPPEAKADDGKPKDGPIEPPPPPKIEWPVIVKFDERGEFRTTIAFEDTPLKWGRFFFTGKANVAYMVEAIDRPEISVSVTIRNGAIAIGPLDQSRPRNQGVVFDDTEREYEAWVLGEPEKLKEPFTVRIRAWDENEPLPAVFQLPAPKAAVPKIGPAKSVPKQMFVGGAFAPNRKAFWLSGHDMTLSLWDAALTKKAGYKLKKRLYALAVDGKGRLYAQTGPADTGGPALAQRTLGDIAVYDHLDPKGDADDLPPPSRTFLLNGLVGRMITAPDRRAVYFLDVHNQALGRIDTEAGKIDRTLSGLSPGTRAFCLTPDGHKIYCCADSGHIDVIDALKFTLESSVTLTRGKPFEIAATDKGVVFVLMPDEKAGRGVCAIVDLSKPVADKAGVFPVACGHHGQFLQVLPDQSGVLISGDGKLSVCVAPPRPALQKALCVEHPVRAALAPGWIQLSPDGKTLLHDAGEILSIGR